MVRQSPSYRLVVHDSPDPADLAMLEERVAAACLAVAGVDEEQEFGIFLQGDEGEIVAGISGIVLGGCCEIQAMWVDEALRRRGLARALIGAAEAEAAGRGCELIMFHAYDALTHRFYERLGYRTAGVIEDCLAGAPMRWYAKDLAPAAPDAESLRRTPLASRSAPCRRPG